MPEISSEVEPVLVLARKNYQAVLEYFTPQSSPIEPDHVQQSVHQEGVMFPAQEFQLLMAYLKQTGQVLTRKFSTSTSTKENEYRFLRGLWAGHSARTKTNAEMTDKFDSLNQVISQLKVRMRGLTENYQRQQQEVWNEQEIREILENHQKHPAFEKISQKLSRQAMLSSQLTAKINVIAQDNRRLKEKNQELEGKVLTLKEKCKKNQRNMFELTKKKAALEKKMYDLELGESSILDISKMSLNSQYFSTRQSHSSNLNLTISGVKCVEESEAGQTNLELKNILSESSTVNSEQNQSYTDLKMSLKLNLDQINNGKENKAQNLSSARQKYRNMKKTSRRTTAPYNTNKNQALNSSIDGQNIKAMKFQRKNSKALLLTKEQKQSGKSIRYSQVL